ncbi:hypothetical protein LB505_013907 [Fusarium chuoi]|nr:hypothetical protein LB505_013907 [Fusarium chuoi]
MAARHIARRLWQPKVENALSNLKFSKAVEAREHSTMGSAAVSKSQSSRKKANLYPLRCWAIALKPSRPQEMVSLSKRCWWQSLKNAMRSGISP